MQTGEGGLDGGDDERDGDGDGGGTPGGFRFGPAPRDEPLVYPGAAPSHSYLFTGDAIEPLDGVDATGLHGDDHLDRRLDELRAAPLERRHAVLAYGSNRSPAQLASKLATLTTSRVVPVVRARIRGASVIFAAYLTRYGSVPATLCDDPGAETDVAVTFLDDHQLEAVDATEPDRGRPLLDPARHPLTLLSGAELSSCRCYPSPRPWLTWDGRPIRLREVGSDRSVLTERSQTEVHRALLGLWAGIGGFHDERSFVAAARSQAEVLRAANDLLRGLVAGPVGRLGAQESRWPADR